MLHGCSIPKFLFVYIGQVKKTKVIENNLHPEWNEVWKIIEIFLKRSFAMVTLWISNDNVNHLVSYLPTLCKKLKGRSTQPLRTGYNIDCVN